MQVEEKPMDDLPKSPNRTKKQGGFTLIETSCALLVMMIAGLGICAVFAYAIKSNTGSRDRAAALAVAQQQMENYRYLMFNDAALTATGSTVTPITVTSADRTYSVRTTITDTTSSLKTIQIQVTPQLSNASWSNGTVQISVQRSAFTLGSHTGGL
jgi:Tfp pilus assembly protein PilV